MGTVRLQQQAIVTQLVSEVKELLSEFSGPL
jgi:hypothetical protein